MIAFFAIALFTLGSAAVAMSLRNLIHSALC
jgi:NADH:ubiquinone oxidoreductase subunit 6 (subunit J)